MMWWRSLTSLVVIAISSGLAGATYYPVSADPSWPSGKKERQGAL